MIDVSVRMQVDICRNKPFGQIELGKERRIWRQQGDRDRMQCILWALRDAFGTYCRYERAFVDQAYAVQPVQSAALTCCGAGWYYDPVVYSICQSVSAVCLALSFLQHHPFAFNSRLLPRHGTWSTLTMVRSGAVGNLSILQP